MAVSVNEHHASSNERTDLPLRIAKLRPRMREIATVVYKKGGATTQEVHDSIVDPPTIYAVRTMLIRLSRKGILKRRPSGQHSLVMYLPAILTDDVREMALESFLERHFDNSGPTALEVLLQLL